MSYDKKPVIIYILGLFEILPNTLYGYLRDQLERIGYECKAVELYAGTAFGSYAFTEEVQRIGYIVDEDRPHLIIGHSLGAYVALLLNKDIPLILIEPSLPLENILSHNLRQNRALIEYDDGTHRTTISDTFLASIQALKTIDQFDYMAQGSKIAIIGAGLAGYEVAQKYHNAIRLSKYEYIPGTDHNISDLRSKKRVFQIIKRRLASKRSR